MDETYLAVARQLPILVFTGTPSIHHLDFVVDSNN